MKAVIQRVKNASVTVNNQIISSIQHGLLVFIGIHRNDTPQHSESIARKVLSLRIFPRHDKQWDASVMDMQGDVLFVSQFTLYGILKGNKIDYHNAMIINS
jgi:D-tyrosyl-tRNA(Tyr) deacylase